MESNSIPVRESNLFVWGPIYITLNLEKNEASNAKENQGFEAQNNQEKESNLVAQTAARNQNNENQEEKADSSSNIMVQSKKNKSVNILSPAPAQVNNNNNSNNPENSKKITYIYNLIDHGMDCECIDLKGELLIRSALPTYRKISQGIEYEQITTNQVKIIITSRVLDNYQEIFQGFTLPKATFRIWILGYKFKNR